MVNDERDLIGMREATRLTGLHEQTLYRLARRGGLRKFKVLGRSVRFERSEVLALTREERPAQRRADVALTA